MLVPLVDATARTCGGKAATLGALVRAGHPVPDGFLVPFDAYLAAGSRVGDPLPDDLRAALAQALGALGDPPVAVRSSADDEDTARASAAGQYETVLGVQGADQVSDAIRTCWASLHSAAAVAYRAAAGATRPERPAMGVLVQRLVDAQVSGVMFTPSGPDQSTEIEASWGLGTSVVGGTVTPDSYRVTAGTVVTRRIADKRTRVDRTGTSLVRGPVADGDRDRGALDDATVIRLAELGNRVAAVLGGGQDIEWVLADGVLWVVQARAVTVQLPAPPGPDTPRAALTGTPGSRGTTTGTARVVRGPADFARVRPGDILVCPWTDPGWTPLLAIVAGVVTQTGGMLSHAAIVARERGIPAVLGVPDAMTTVRDSTTIAIDGATGTVTTTEG